MRRISLIIMILIAAPAMANPVSMAVVYEDTVKTEEVQIYILVDSPIPWDTGGGIGLYFQREGSTGWGYVSGDPYTVERTWTPPDENTTYYLATTMDDNDGNSEGYTFTHEDSLFYCPSCPDPCGDLTISDHVMALADAGVTSWGDVMIEYYWRHPTSGEPVAKYTGEFQITTAEADTLTVLYDDIPVGDDPDYGFFRIDYQYGSSVRLRVAGVDAGDREGPFSPWAVWWEDDGPPGAPWDIKRTIVK